MAKRSKKKRTHVATGTAEGTETKVPKSLVIRRGKTAQEVADLVQDVRHMMMPYTAIHFQEDAKNRKLTLQQYSKHVALPMGISHLMAFSQNENRLNLRLGRTPEGPTLHFRVHSFSLSKHIKALQRRPISNTAGLQANPPVVVTNNFGDYTTATTSTSGGGGAANKAAAVDPHVKLMRITFQNLFPAINVATVKLNECRRVVLFNLIPGQVSIKKSNSSASGDGDDDDNDEKILPMVEMRHYAIQASAVGVHRRVRKLTSASKSKKLPDLGKMQDIADYVTGQTATGSAASGSLASDFAPSDSEAEEEDPRHTLELPDSYMGQRKSQKSALKLVELGPRLSLSLIKVEKGLGQGDVLYHAHFVKSPQEVAELKAKREQEAALKQQRRATQEATVERKRKAAEEKLLAKRQRKEERQQALLQKLRQGGGCDGEDDEEEFAAEEKDLENDDDDDDHDDSSSSQGDKGKFPGSEESEDENGEE